MMGRQRQAPREAAGPPGDYRHARGAWEPDPGHFPLPLSPAFASLYLPWQEEALTAMFAAYGCLAGRAGSRLIDGLLYYRVAPAGGWTPPRWLLPYASWFWPLSPAIAVRVLRAKRRWRTRFDRRVLARWRSHWRSRIEREQRDALQTNLTDLSRDGLLAAFDRLVTQTGRNVRLHFLLHGAIALPLYQLDCLLRATNGEAPVRLQDLLAGASPASRAPAEALAALAAALRARPDALARAVALGPERVASALQAVDQPFAAGVGAWMERFGHRVLGRYEFAEPAVAERPQLMVAEVLRLAAAGAPAPPRTDPAAAAAAAVRGRLPAAERPRFDALLAEARAAYAVRDDNVVLTYNASFALVRYLMLEAGRRWQGDLLGAAEDVFFLTAGEMRTALADPAAARSGAFGALAGARRRNWEQLRRRPHPQLNLGPPLTLPPLAGLPREAAFMNQAIVWYLRAIQTIADGESGGHQALLTGLGASAGRYCGPARVINTEGDFHRIQTGDVLVCTMTSPAWSTVLAVAGALVTEYGGLLSHPAVIAREFGIPAVIGVPSATTAIQDGQRVIVDGSLGRVELEA